MNEKYKMMIKKIIQILLVLLLLSVGVMSYLSYQMFGCEQEIIPLSPDEENAQYQITQEKFPWIRIKESDYKTEDYCKYKLPENNRQADNGAAYAEERDV